MHFYLGSFGGGLATGVKDGVGVMDTVEQIHQRRALTDATRSETALKERAYEDAGNAAREAQANRGPQMTSDQWKQGATSGAAPPLFGPPKPPDLGTVPVPKHLAALIPPAYGAPTPPDPTHGALPGGGPLSADAPADGPPALPPSSASPINPTFAPAYQTPVQRVQSQQAPPPNPALPAPRTTAPQYLPGQQGIPTNGEAPFTIGQRRPIRPDMMPGMMVPTLASSQIGMGASIMAAMDPTMGNSA